jgi:hypothetical protein
VKEYKGSIMVNFRSSIYLLDLVFLTAYQRTLNQSLAMRKRAHLKFTRVLLNEDLSLKDDQ